MKVEIVGGNLVITLPLNTQPEVSKSGKSKIVAGTGGFAKSDAEFKGKKISVSVNAIIPL